MRLATLIISGVLSLAAGLQSCAVAAGGSISKDLSTTAQDKQQADNLSAAGGSGAFAAFLWLVAAAFVMSKPKVSAWIFAVSSLFWLGAGAGGFSDGYIWAGASVVFALMSWRGIREKRDKDEQERARYAADVAVAAGTIQQAPAAIPPGWYVDPQGSGMRYWDGIRWSEYVHPDSATAVEVQS